ncbi:MAG: 30S ribosomal protein S1 [Spirochaetota bacterium]|nr:30S ribosomal protein S1 [Spirochaetota bacterium]
MSTEKSDLNQQDDLIDNSVENEEVIDNECNQNFAELLENNHVDSHMYITGQMVDAEIIKIAGEWIFLNVGGKSEGYLEAKELIDEDGNLTVKEGDKIKAYLLSSQNEELHFTTRISGENAGLDLLQMAYKNGIPVEGFVEREVKGGCEVKIGNTRAFCPYSQIGMGRENIDKYITEHLPFKIIEFSENGRNIILSNRAILEEKRQAQIETLKDSLHEGKRIKGHVKSIQDFGAFVDIGGIQALLPISEISRGKVDDIRQSLSIGQEIEVAVINLDWENEKISLSIKELQPDPWDDAKIKYTKGSHHTGEITRITNFGAFVTLEPGLDGLIHISELGDNARIKHPREIVNEGERVEVQIAGVDIEKRRISLRPVVYSQKDSEMNNYQQYMNKKDDSYNPFSNLGDLLKDKIDKKK